jgi:hypothetical protein
VEDLKAETTRATLPLPEAYPAEAPRKIAAEEREFQAFKTLRIARADQRYQGVRKARAAKVSCIVAHLIFYTHLPSLERGGGSFKEEIVYLDHTTTSPQNMGVASPFLHHMPYTVNMSSFLNDPGLRGH